MVNVGIIGIGGMGRLHFNCYKANAKAAVKAICDIDRQKRDGDWSRIGLNVDTSKSGIVDLSGIRTYEDWRDIAAQNDLDVIDICLPTSLHAEVTAAALNAGKHVLCEKPMAFSVEECDRVQAAYEKSGKLLMIGHCLRYWPEYVAAERVIRRGEYGKVLRASFHRSGGAPIWSWDNWLLDGGRSGGAVLDMHVHDIDAALWWFGKPDRIRAAGFESDGLPLSVDAVWEYDRGPVVSLHGSWDMNGGPFRYAFQVVMERGTVSFDSAVDKSAMVYSADQASALAAKEGLAYQFEIDDLVESVAGGRPIAGVTPRESALAVSVALEEIRQIRP